MKAKLAIMCVLANLLLFIFPMSALGTDTDNGQTVLVNYLDALQSNDYQTAYTYLSSTSKRDVSYALFVRLQDVNKSIREVTDYKLSFKGFKESTDDLSNKKMKVSVFTVDYKFSEKLAYSLPYNSSSNCSLMLEGGEWKVVLNQTRRGIEEEIRNYQVDQYEDEGKDVPSFVHSLDQKIVDNLEKYGVEGCAVALVENNEIVFSKAYGYANVKRKIAATTDTVFNVGSVSKTVSAWGVLKLYEAGLIDLDSPAQMYMKRWTFPNSEFDPGKITVRQLLEHRSGLRYSENRGYEGYRTDSRIPDLVQSLRGDIYPQYAVRQEFASGDKFEYSNANYTVLQLIIEDATGIPFEEYMQKEILKPLHMKDSTFRFEKVSGKPFATGYDNIGKSFPVYIHTEQAGGGLYSTANDMAQFVIAMNRTLSPEEGKSRFLSGPTVKPILDVKSIDYKLGSYIYHSELAPLLMQHQGHSKGYMALYATLPEAGSGIVFLTNSDNGKAVMQPLADKWLRWKAGPSKPILSTLHYTLQKNRDKVENAYIIMVVGLTALLMLFIISIISGIITKKRTYTTLYLLFYSKINLAIGLMAPILAIVWWSVVYDRLFDAISPFSETSLLDLSVASLVTALCTAIMLNLLYPKT